ncbi:hypothetical protein M0R45_034862 [Rubus argutus]|uniref:Uncharacterized protein n=1 Tax=Rubus argutus TaxID=59490 RepID=A0AAW1VVK3_RUBAR
MIRDMGREIVRLESKEPGKRSRLWHPKDSLHTLRENSGSKEIEGLSLNMNMYHVSTTRNSGEVVLETTAFTSMRKLRLLELCDVQLNGCYQEFPKGLRWLCWSEYPLDSIPNDFVLENLVVLEMHYGSLKQVWKGTKHLPSLKTLDLSHCHGLTESGLPRVRDLSMASCESLEKVTFQSLSCLPERIRLFSSGPSQIVEIEHWYKLVPIGRVDVEMINLLGLCSLDPMEPIRMETPASVNTTMEIQGLYEYGIFSTFLPGTVNKVPGEFSHSSIGGFSISFTVPLLSNHRIRGLNIYCVYAKDSNLEGLWASSPVIIIVRNKSKDLRWIYWPSCYGIPGKEQDLIWLSHWKFGNQLEAGNQITASVFSRHTPYVVKEWGIRIVHEEEDTMCRPLYNSCRKDPDNEEVIGIGGDLSELYLVLPGIYFFCGGPIKEHKKLYAFWIEASWIRESGEEIGKGGIQQAEPDGMLAAAEAEERGGISNFCGCKILVVHMFMSMVEICRNLW